MFLTWFLLAVAGLAASPRPNPIAISVAASLVHGGHQVEVLSAQAEESFTLTTAEAEGRFLPPGPLFALRRDRDGRLIGVALPRRYPAGRALLEKLDAPLPGRIHLLVRAERSIANAASAGSMDVRFLVEHGAERLVPAAIGRDDRGLLALFPNFSPGGYTVRMEGERWRTAESRVELDTDAVFRETILALQRKPSISVQLDVDPSLAKKIRTVSLFECAGWVSSVEPPPDLEECRALGSRKIDGNMAEFHFVEPLPHLVEVSVEDHVKRLRADARGEEDLIVGVSMKTTRLHGRVLQNGAGVAASLLFQGNPTTGEGEELTPGPRSRGQSAATGEFEIALWPDLYTVEIAVDGQERPPSAFALAVDEQEEREKDFVISANSVVVTLVDSTTGRGVPGRLLLSNVMAVGEGPPVVHTDETGRARLLSVHSGRIHLVAIAPGFVKTTADIEVREAGEQQAYEVRMNPEQAGGDFRVLLPDGSPAAGVEGFFRYDSDSGLRLRIPCDDAGICHPAGVLSDSERIGLYHSSGGLTFLSPREIREAGAAVLRPSGGRLEIRIEAGGESDALKDGALHATVRVGDVAVGSYLPGVFLNGETWSYGPQFKPMWLEGLPAGPMIVEIRTARYDDQRRPVGKTVAGPFMVILPSEPVTIRLR